MRHSLRKTVTMGVKSSRREVGQAENRRQRRIETLSENNDGESEASDHSDLLSTQRPVSQDADIYPGECLESFFSKLK